MLLVLLLYSGDGKVQLVLPLRLVLAMVLACESNEPCWVMWGRERLLSPLRQWHVLGSFG